MSEKPVASIKTLARYAPDTVYIGTGEYVAECVRADDGEYYLAADVDAALEAAQAERDAQQAEIERLREQLRLATVDQATAEADANDARVEIERLREALAGLITWIPSSDTYRRLGFDPATPMQALEEARAALEQEDGRGQ